MLTHYIKIAIRSLLKNRIYSFINLFGLAVGIACCLLIILFVRDEWSYDDFHPDAERIYRVAVEENYGEGQRFFNAVTPFPVGPLLRDTYPEFETFVRVAMIRNLVQREEKAFTERIHLIDPAFFTMFNFPLLQGKATTDLNSVIVTEAMAEKYFSGENPIGKSISIQLANSPKTFVVAGIAQNPPSNTSIRFDFLISLENGNSIWSDRQRRSFTNVIPETYIRLSQGFDVAELSAKLPALFKKKWGERFQEGMYNLHFQPLLDIHLNTDYPAGIEPISDPAYSYILGAIALLVLLIACINFVTLTLGRSAERAREVGVRKVVGAGRPQLIRQFWGETVLLSFAALLLGVVVAEFALPGFNDLAGKTLALQFDGMLIFFMAGLMLFIGLLAGSYPAVFLSRFHPVAVLKGTLRIGSANLLRQGLTVFQFALSVFLIVCTLGMAKQLTYLQQKNLGFDREQVVVIPTGLPSAEGVSLFKRFRNELATHNVIADVTASAFAFGEGWASIGYGADDGAYRDFNLNMVQPGYLKAMGMELIAGRGFSDDISADATEAFIINEAFAAEFGLENPIGQQVPGSRFPHKIIGVVKDFNYRSLHSPVTPLALVIDPRPVFQNCNDVSFSVSPSPKIAVRIKPGNIPVAMDLIKQTWENTAPGLEFDYAFLDEALDRQYRQEEHLSAIVQHATVFAILIACLGLFGLAALVVSRRTKEIGVRKVLGASVPGITMLIAKDFIKLVLIAIIVSAPAAYFALREWLQEFAYRASIGPGVFLLAGLMALGIALLTVSFQAIKAGLMNPVESLRYE